MSDKPIEERIKRLARRLDKGAQKLRPLTKDQKAELRSALAAHLEKTHDPVKAAAEAHRESAQKPRQSQNKSKSQDHGHSH